jgi:hypothetical protein
MLTRAPPRERALTNTRAYVRLIGARIRPKL